MKSDKNVTRVAALIVSVVGLSLLFAVRESSPDAPEAKLTNLRIVGDLPTP